MVMFYTVPLCKTDQFTEIRLIRIQTVSNVQLRTQVTVLQTTDSVNIYDVQIVSFLQQYFIHSRPTAYCVSTYWCHMCCVLGIVQTQHSTGSI